MFDWLRKWQSILLLVSSVTGWLAYTVIARALEPIQTRVTVLETQRDAMANDLNEIKRDVKELLKRR